MKFSYYFIHILTYITRHPQNDLYCVKWDVKPYWLT